MFLRWCDTIFSFLLQCLHRERMTRGSFLSGQALPASLRYRGNVCLSNLKWRNLCDLQVNSEAVQTACPVPFDEGRLWKGKDGPQLKRQLQSHFHNITSAMDCVGCEKCKLWGKLQLLGEGLMHGLLRQPCTQCSGASSSYRMLGMQALGDAQVRTQASNPQ